MRAAVLGSPIAHSLSPALHRAAYGALGLPDWRYDAIELRPAALEGFLTGLGPGWAGLSLTMPLKQAVLPLLSSRSALVELTGAANTVVLAEGERRGDNTDVAGMVAALAGAGIHHCRAPVILGSGATARSALAAVAQLGSRHVRLLARSAPDDALRTAEALGLQVQVHRWETPSRGPTDQVRSVLAGCDLLISTVPAGTEQLAPYVADVPVLFDVVYAPWPTPLAVACNGVVVGGAELLLHQAARQVELMTGRPAPLAAMRAALPVR